MPTLYRTLPTADRQRVRDSLLNTADVRIGVELWDPDNANAHQAVSLTDGPIYVTGGEVQMDMASDVSRSCSLDLADTTKKLGWGKRTASDYALFPGVMIHVTYEVWDRTLSTWVAIPVFTGPVMAFSRVGGEVNIQALGKEVLAQEPRVLWNSKTFPKGTPYLQMIRFLMGAMGERHFDFPPKPWRHRTHRRIAIHRGVSVWPICRLLAQRAGQRCLYYRANGTLVCRTRNMDRPIWVFNKPDLPLHVLDDPRFNWDFGELTNAAQVRYTQGDKNPVISRVYPKWHPYSPQKLSINGEPLFLASFHETAGGKPRANEMLTTVLRNAMAEPISVEFESVGLPFMEEYSRAMLVWEGERFKFPLRSWSLGLGPAGTLSVNVNTNQLRRVKTGA